jgi:glutamate carboxypeptidase
MGGSLTARIQSYVDDHAGDELQFVIDLCNQNSYTYNAAGTNLIAEMILDRMGGILPHRETVWQAEVGDHHILRTRPASNSYYLVGHMDTVFPPDHPFQECAIEGDWLVGPGTGDMKGGIGVMIYALKALDEVGLLDGMDIALVLSADEEIGAVTSRSIYEKERRNAVACLVAECAGPAGEVVLSRNGKAGLRLSCSGVERHVGRASSEKSSAILEIAHKVLALESLNACFPGVSVNVGKIEGGLGPCTVPAEATCLVDVRWLEEKHYEIVLSGMQDIVSHAACLGCACTLTLLNQRPAMPMTGATESLYGALENVARSLGMSVGREHRRGTSDANFFGAAGIPTIDGFGPVCQDDHTTSERIHVPSLADRTALLALFLAEGGRN